MTQIKAALRNDQNDLDYSYKLFLGALDEQKKGLLIKLFALYEKTWFREEIDSGKQQATIRPEDIQPYFDILAETEPEGIPLAISDLCAQTTLQTSTVLLAEALNDLQQLENEKQILTGKQSELDTKLKAYLEKYDAVKALEQESTLLERRLAAVEAVPQEIDALHATTQSLKRKLEQQPPAAAEPESREMAELRSKVELLKRRLVEQAPVAPEQPAKAVRNDDGDAGRDAKIAALDAELAKTQRYAKSSRTKLLKSLSILKTRLKEAGVSTKVSEEGAEEVSEAEEPAKEKPQEKNKKSEKRPADNPVLERKPKNDTPAQSPRAVPKSAQKPAAGERTKIRCMNMIFSKIFAILIRMILI